SDPSVRLYVSERDSDEVRRQAEAMATPTTPVAGKKRRRKSGKGKANDLQGGDVTASALKSTLDVDVAIAVGAGQDDEAMLIDSPVTSTPGAATAVEPCIVVERAAGSALASTEIVKRKRQKKGRVLQKLGLVEAQDSPSSADEDEASSAESDFDSSASESESDSDNGAEKAIAVETSPAPQQGTLLSSSTPPVATVPSSIPQKEKVFYTGSMLKPLLAKRGQIEDSGATGQTFYITVDRPEHIQQQRAQLPVYAEEQQIMEAIAENAVVVLSGETGSGKTTQVPQFLFEAGYGDPGSSNPGIIGITQPRRVAAISMAHRVSEELGNFGSTVAHQ
ncbi:putative ATP-dependent RNA helicase DHR1, partial [Coemansia sp. S17]